MFARCPDLVSILVPIRDEAANLDRFLDRLVRLHYPDGAVEVLFAEGASRDGTRERLLASLPLLVQAKPSWRFRLVDNPSGEIPAGLNAALAESRGDVVFRLDAHTLFPEDYLERCVETLLRTGADNVGGVVVAVPGTESATAAAIARARGDLFGAGNSSFRTGFSSGPRRTVPFGCFRREVFGEVGLFDPRLLRNQDIELNRRIVAAGGRVHQEGGIVSHYIAPRSFAELARKHFANGLWNILASAVSPGCLSPAHAVPGLFLLAVAASAAVHPLAPLALLGLQIGANLARAASVGRGVSRLRLFAAFTVIQTAHGLGQWRGLLGLPRFLLRSRPQLSPA
ncbi:MAG: glycosyltransferase [Planctomycetaceae bacterium]